MTLVCKSEFCIFVCCVEIKTLANYELFKYINSESFQDKGTLFRIKWPECDCQYVPESVTSET